jgi:hypothetical protein
MKGFAIAAGLALLAAPAFAGAVAPGDAGKHVGEVVTVEGVVAGVHAAPNGTILIDLGGRYPDNSFVAVIFPGNTPRFGPLSGYVGNRVQISGSVQLYHGKPEITLTNEGQIQVITPGHSQKLMT